MKSSGGDSGGRVGRVRVRARRKEKEDSRSRVMHGANGQSAVKRQDNKVAACVVAQQQEGSRELPICSLRKANNEGPVCCLLISPLVVGWMN